MWLSQRLSAFNKQLRKPIKSQSTTLPSKRSKAQLQTGLSSSQQQSLPTLLQDPNVPSLSPEPSVTTPLVLNITKATATPATPATPATAATTATAATAATATNDVVSTLPSSPNEASGLPSSSTTSTSQVALYTTDIPLEILVVGASQVTKSAAIRLGFDDARPVRSKYKGGNTFQTKLIVDQTSYPLDLVKMDDTYVIDTTEKSSKMQKDFTHFDGAIVCYDTNSRSSMDCLPDLLNAFLTWRIPVHLVGLETNLTGQCETDPQLGKKLATLFGIHSAFIDVYAPHGEKQMRAVYITLVQQIIHPKKRRHHSTISTNSANTSNKASFSGTSIPRRRPVSTPPPKQQQPPTPHQRRNSVRKRNSNPISLTSSGGAISPQTRKRDSMVGRHPSGSSSISSASSSSSSTSPPPLKRYQLRSNQQPAHAEHADPTSNKSVTSAKAVSKTPRPISTYDPRSGLLTPPLSPIRPTSICLPLLPTKKQVFTNPCFTDDLGVPPPASNGTGLTADSIVKKLTLWDYHDQETLTMIFLTFYRKFMTPYQLLQSLIERFEHDYGCDHQPTRLQERIRTILCLWLSHHWGDIYHGQSHQTLHLFLRRLGHNQQLSTMYQLLGPLITRPGPANDPDSVWGLTDEESPSSNPNNCHKNSLYEAWANSPSITTMLCMSASNHSMTSDDSSTVRNKHQRRSSSFDWYNEVDPLHASSSSIITSTSSTTHRGRNTPLATPYPTVSVDSKLARHKKKKEDSTRTSFFKNGISTKSNKRSSHQQFMGHLASFGGGLVLLETTGRRPFSLIALQSSLRHMSHVRYAMLMDLSVDLLAEQLTWVELTLYRNIKPRDYIRHLWGEKGASEAMVAFLSHAQFIKGWVVSMVLMQNHPCQQVCLYAKFVDLAYRLYHDHRNYNTLASVLDGLHGLQPIKQGLDDSKQQQLQELEALMSPDRNYAVYRRDFEDSNDGTSIPYLAVHRLDIVTLAETKRDVTLCGGIHWEKFRFMGELILRLTQAISFATLIQPNPGVLAFVSDTTLLTEAERCRKLDDLRAQ